jgi:hypothetical protein
MNPYSLTADTDTPRHAACYVRRGLKLVGQTPVLYLFVTAAYTAPAVVAAGLTVAIADPSPWQRAFITSLPWLTTVLGAVVIMVVVGYQAHGQIVDPWRATRVGVRWVPRYLWTNVHTSIIFWVPIGLLLTLRGWLQSIMGDVSAADFPLNVVWWLVLAGAALYLHARTLLAPFLAVHADLPGTLAMLVAWRLAGQHLGLCVATFVIGSLPVGLPLALVALAVIWSLSDSAEAAVMPAIPDLVWAGIQLIRLVLIPGVYLLFRDLWHVEQARGGPHVPRAARLPLAVTHRLPKFGSWS